MSLDDQGWVERYVAQGGDRNTGQELFERMRAARGGKAATMPPSTSDARDATRCPSAVPPVPDAAPPRTPASASAEPDLFEGAPTPVPPISSAMALVKSKAPARRGRKASDMHAAPRTQKELDLFELSMEIERKDAKEAREAGDIGYLATAMIYASLPHSEHEGAVFKRKNGPVSLTIMNDPDIGLPYGKIPRIITAFLCTEAKAQKSPQIKLGKSQAEFMGKLGLSSRGGKRGDISRFREQAKRLFTSTITLIGEPGSAFEFHWKRVNIADEGMLLWNPHEPTQQSRWESTITLSEKFFDECMNHSFPIFLPVMHSLRSPLAIDIYVWLTYRFNEVRSPTPITWRQLKWQFGSNYADTDQGEYDFKRNFKAMLRQVQSVYKEANLRVDPDALVLLPSKPHVLR